MIRRIFKLVRPGLFLPVFEEVDFCQEYILVKPTILSICAADQRYFNGNRPKEVLEKKLPLALIHEGIGEVLFDPSKEFVPGQQVVLLPNGGTNSTDSLYGNNPYFRSSTADGFTQELLTLSKKEIIPFQNKNTKYFVFSELLSVCFHAIGKVTPAIKQKTKSIGVWGDGIVGYLLSYCLKKEFPNAKIIVFGRHDEKLQLFSHADRTEIASDSLCEDYPETVDLLFECVGGGKSEDALRQMISLASPQAFICLTGVSEQSVRINTRKILEKGISLIGSSRSTRSDFEKALSFLDKSDEFSWLDKVISSERTIISGDDLWNAFREENSLPFKMLLFWDV